MTRSELRTEARQYMISLKSGVETSIQKLSNDLQTVNQATMENVKYWNNVSDYLREVTDERLNNLTIFVNMSHSELRNEARQSMILLKSDVETSIQKLSNDLQTVNQSTKDNFERCNNVSDTLTIVTNERLKNLTVFVTTTQSELRNEARKSLILLESEVETSIQKLSNDLQTVNQITMENVERCNNVSNSFAIVSNEQLKNLTAFVTTTHSELINETRLSLISLKYYVETSIQKLSNDLQTVNQTFTENVERWNNVSDYLRIFTNERLNNLTAFVNMKHSELINGTRLSLISLKSDVETSIQKHSNDLQTVNQSTTDNFERCNNVSDTLTIVTNERLNNLTAFVTTAQSELRYDARKALISLKSDVETSIQKLFNELQTVNQTTMENVERCNNVIDSFAIVTDEQLKNLTAFVTTTHSELINETRLSLISLKSDVETSIQKLSKDVYTVNRTAVKSVERCNNVSDSWTIVTNERLNNLSAFVTTIQSELQNEARQSVILLKSDVETSINKLSSNIRTMNQTAVENVERCNNVSDSLTVVTNERLNKISAFVTTRQSELQNEARQSVVLLKSDVETSIQKLSIDFRTLNQTAMKNIESCKNVSDSMAKLTNERLNNLSAFVATKQSELQNETRQSLFSLKSDVEKSIKKISNDLHTVNQTAMKHVECCKNVGDKTLTNNTFFIESCKNAPKSNGVYNMYYEKSATLLRVYCDQTTDGGGWLVIQRRKDGSVDFERTWADYKTGFGNIENEFWIGNDNLHALTSSGLNELRIDMEDFDGNKSYAKYTHFKVHPELELYRLEVSGYSGDAGNSLIIDHNGKAFSTKDRDNDKWSGHCSVGLRGAWWYSDCGSSNLNGLYYRGGNSPDNNGIFWFYWKGWNNSLKTVEMKIR